MRRSVAELWEASYLPGRWCATLYDEFLSGSQGKDFDTIRFWIERFKAGENTTIQVSSDGYVCDGNHRLVAAKLAGLTEIGIEPWCWG
jgi:hypothetical protein